MLTFGLNAGRFCLSLSTLICKGLAKLGVSRPPAFYCGEDRGVGVSPVLLGSSNTDSSWLTLMNKLLLRLSFCLRKCLIDASLSMSLFSSFLLNCLLPATRSIESLGPSLNLPDTSNSLCGSTCSMFKLQIPKMIDFKI